jgi:predicted transcriptional regulator of viral defense system
MTSQEKQIMQCLLYLRRHIGMEVTHKQIKDTFGSVQIKLAFSHLYNLGYLEQVNKGSYIVKPNMNSNLKTILQEVKRYRNRVGRESNNNQEQ